VPTTRPREQQTSIPFAFAFTQRDVLTDFTASVFVSENLSACPPMLHMPLNLHYLDVYRLCEVRRRRALQHGPRQDHDVCFKPHVLVERRQMVGMRITRYELEMARAYWYYYSSLIDILHERFRSIVSPWGQIATHVIARGCSPRSLIHFPVFRSLAPDLLSTTNLIAEETDF